MLRVCVPAVLSLVCLVGGVRGAEDPWRATLALSRTALEQGRSRDAEEAGLTALRQAEEGRADEDDLASVRLLLADACLRQGAEGRAERWVWRAQEPLERLHGTDHAEVARCLYLRAEVFRRLGLVERAEPLARQALAIRRKTLGDNQPVIADSLEQLARIWAGMGFGNAGDLLYPGVTAGSWAAAFPAALALRQRTQGKEHPARIAAELRQLDRLVSFEERQKQRRRVLARLIETKGRAHPLVARCLLMLSQVPFPLGGGWDDRLKEAEQRLNEALALWREHPSPDPADVVAGLRHLATLRNVQGRYAQAETLWAEANVRSFANLSDADLCRFFLLLVPTPRFREPNNKVLYEHFLTEMVRRGGPVIEACLEERHRRLYQLHVRHQLSDVLSALHAPLLDPFGLRLPDWEGDFQNLDLLTALRRVQGKPDPLRILVKATARLECEFPDLPVLQVCLKNLDAERLDIDYTAGGDYRSGRESRWHFVVHDEQGNLLPGRGMLVGEDGLVSGGGVDVRPESHYGGRWETELAMRNYLNLDRPGTYEVQIVHHDRDTIDDVCDAPFGACLAGRMLCRSDPLRLTVKPRRIVMERGDRDSVRRLLDALDENGPVKVVAGTYDGGAHKFVPPESPAGRLLGLGWKAVPVLLQEVARADLSEKRRAWELALLFGITGYHDPRRASADVLGGRESQERVWWWSNHRIVGGWSAVRTRQGKIDPDKQREFARRWQGFEKNLEVTEPSAPGR